MQTKIIGGFGLKFFKYKKLYSTYKIDDYIKISNILTKNKIEFTYHVKDIGCMTSLKAYRGGRGAYAADSGSMKEYTIYVNRNDYDRAGNVFGFPSRNYR